MNSLPTQSFIEIDDIRDGTIYLKGGGLRKVLIVGGINFDLKSSEEQQLILGGFQSFLNTLDFSVQFFVHSRKTNVNSYLKKIKEREVKEKNELLKTQISEYMNFIKSFIAENPIISKSFFVVIPYDSTITPGEAKKRVMKLFGASKKKSETKTTKESLEKKIQQLSYRVNQVITGLEQIGLHIDGLSDDELTELFYNLYNPELTEKKGGEVPRVGSDISKQNNS